MIAVHVMGSASREASGPSQSVPALVAAQREQGAQSWLWSVEPPEACQPRESFHRTFRRDLTRFPALNPDQRSGDFARALAREIRAGDVVHSHGLWLMANAAPAFAARRAGAVFGLSPRGMLAPEAMAFSSAKKQLFWRLVQKRALKLASFLHATAESEYQEMRAVGLSNPVTVIPNGVDIPEPSKARGASRTRTVLSLGRLHPKKNIAALIQAWARIEPEHSDWALRIAGPSEGRYKEELQALIRSLSLQRVSVEAPIYGAEKQAAYRAAELFVLPSLNENFGMTVAEALAAGTPALVSKGAPWGDLERRGCGWWVDRDDRALEAGLREAMARPRAELAGMGARGRDWMQSDFSWAAVAVEMLAVYRWTLGQGDRPASVRVD